MRADALLDLCAARRLAADDAALVDVLRRLVLLGTRQAAARSASDRRVVQRDVVAVGNGDQRDAGLGERRAGSPRSWTPRKPMSAEQDDAERSRAATSTTAVPSSSAVARPGDGGGATGCAVGRGGDARRDVDGRLAGGRAWRPRRPRPRRRLRAAGHGVRRGRAARRAAPRRGRRRRGTGRRARVPGRA